MLPNFYLFVSLHNGLGSLHGIRTGRATRATHATEATVNGQRTGDNRKSTMHETATTTTTTTRSAERQSARRCAGEWECLAAINRARRIHGAGATKWCNPRSHPFFPPTPRRSATRAYCVLCVPHCVARCTAKAGKMLRASCA